MWLYVTASAEQVEFKNSDTLLIECGYTLQQVCNGLSSNNSDKLLIECGYTLQQVRNRLSSNNSDKLLIECGYTLQQVRNRLSSNNGDKLLIECGYTFQQVRNRLSSNCCLIRSSNIIITGDLNLNLFDTDSESSPEMKLNNLMDIFDCKNIVHVPTCFAANKPTLIDVIITNCS